MGKADISVIIPSKNNKSKTAAIIEKIAEENQQTELEFIVIDMNSTDGGVLEALNTIKKRNLEGCVIQSGGGTVSSALNTGIYKSTGKYITFVYPSRLYKEYMTEYFRTAEEAGADLVFAVPGNTPAAQTVPKDITGADVAVRLIRSTLTMDFTAVMFRREFLLEHMIKFDEVCTIGYAEAFMFTALLYDPVIAAADITLERDYLNGLMKDEPLAGSKNCFERFDALLKVRELLRQRHKDDRVLYDCFTNYKLPAVLLNCVDKLLELGFKPSSIRKQLVARHYDDYLHIHRDMPRPLMKKILLWKAAPWLYKP